MPDNQAKTVNPDAKQITIEGVTMGTTYQVKYVDNGERQLLPPIEIKQAIEQLLSIIDVQMSTYRTDSQISQFNQLTAINTPFAIDDDFATVVQEAINLYHLTEGGLNITLANLIHLWGFGASKTPNNTPTAEQIQQCIATLGMEHLELTKISQQATLSKKIADLQIDLSAIAKGFGVDKLANYLQSIGITDYMVEIGGEVFAQGKNLVGQTWRIGIQDPTNLQGNTYTNIVQLDNQALATSGSYKDFYHDTDGVVLPHIIHPTTYQPVQQSLVSLSVIAPTAMMADGLATGLYAMGAKKALEIAEKHNLAIYLISYADEGLLMQASQAFLALADSRLQ